MKIASAEVACHFKDPFVFAEVVAAALKVVLRFPQCLVSGGGHRCVPQNAEIVIVE